jgi:acyl-CoA synthetase (AMP-forming)/AMP-acid ligase II
MTMFHLLEDQSKAIPNHLFLIFEGRTYTYKQFFDKVVNTANWLRKDLGITKGEVVALDAGNSPEYLVLWFAIEGVGGVTAFVNNNLTSKSLVHCVEVWLFRMVVAWA